MLFCQVDPADLVSQLVLMRPSGTLDSKDSGSVLSDWTLWVPEMSSRRLFSSSPAD